MREHLIGYLLGALEPEEHASVEAELRQDRELRREMELLREKLLPLADDQETEPPPGLGCRTYSFVMARLGPMAGQFAASSQWRPQDLLAAAGIFVAAAMLLFPAVLNSRQQAQLRVCQNNLATLGHALIDYSQYHDDTFPVVPASGKLSAAGIYAPVLAENRAIEARDVLCPTSTLAKNEDFRLPTLAELHAAKPGELRRLRSLMGGSYGYCLGYVENGRYHGIRNQSRSTFAIMADQPGAHASTESCKRCAPGQNVLFEDGHVRFMQDCSIDQSGDHIFQNELGYVGAGIGRNDAVIGNSSASPVILHVDVEE